jgi:hypothetical protein
MTEVKRSYMTGREYTLSVWLTIRFSIPGCMGLMLAMAGLPYDPDAQELLYGGMAEIGMAEKR